MEEKGKQAGKRLLAVGDIHGRFDRFQEVWEAVRFRPGEDEVVFLGDYTDRGRQNVPMMKWVMAHQGQPGMTFLRGNHDAMYLDAAAQTESDLGGAITYDISACDAQMLWRGNGGEETYLEIQELEDPLAFHRAWLAAIRQMPLSCQKEWRGQTYFFSHGSIDPHAPLTRQQKDDLLWSRVLAVQPEQYEGEAVLVMGHTPVQLIGYPPVPQILDGCHVILMDTGSFLPKGRVSCMELATYAIWQSRTSP